MTRFILASSAVALVLFAGTGLAHTTVTSTAPTNGSVLAQSPPRIEIRFRDHARLTSAVVIHAGSPDRQLDFSPKDLATTFTIPNPALQAGRNDIKWTALSMDGHVVTGTLALTIKPASAPAN